MHSLRHFSLAALSGLFFSATARAVTFPDTVGNITFTSIPEINPSWSAFGSFVVAAALILRHSAKFRK
jgi:hypothetical protein